MPVVTPQDGIFVTGGSGFVGRRLLPELLALGKPVFALDRSGSLAAMAGAAGLTVVRGDLLQPETYRSVLRSCDVVVHLAAATGRAEASEHRRVNERGTQVLLDACRDAGVAKILFVSSIATTFPPNTGYHYADAKRRAEDAVSKSGLRFVILRPTIITGADSPNSRALEKLALLPLIVMPGTGRVRVQPIDVSDVAGSIAEVIRRDRFTNETVESGGPDVLTMEAFLQQIRMARTGRSGRVLHIPLAGLRIPLRAAEAVGLGARLPITAGQLSSFRFDGVTAEHRSKSSVAVADECRVFTRYLLRCDPDGYVIDHYAAANGTLALSPASGFDGAVLGFARINPLCARIMDSYASLFYRTATLRKRLVLLLAILETRPPFHQAMDRAQGGATPLLLARLSLTTVAALVSLFAGTLILTPVRVLFSLVGKGPR